MTRETGEAHFYSRSRVRLWRKGETSGNTRWPSRSCVRTATATRTSCACGRTGPPATRAPSRVSHRGSGVASANGPTLSSGSYVAELLGDGPGAAAHKLGEEGVEAALAVAAEDDERVVSELADLWFASYVALAARGLDPSDVEAELLRRRR